MKLKNLSETYKQCKPYRNDHYIKWNVHFTVDDDYYLFCLLPTIMIQPGPYRHQDAPIIDIAWFNMHICIGTWARKEKI